MATVMAATAAERAVLEEEFRWLLHDEVHAVLKQLQDILKEASLRFTLPGSGTEGPAKQENFILGSCGTDQVKGVLTLQGDALSQADVNLKMPRNNQLLHFTFREDKQWKLQQIQDARNHVSQAIYLLISRDESYQFKTGAEPTPPLPAADGRSDAAADQSPKPAHHPRHPHPPRDRRQRPHADVRPRPAFRPAGQRLHQPQQALPHSVPAACPAAQLHQELPPSRGRGAA
ncbi:ROGDI isoform 11 [Pongo abelii]|uniref:Protein rogdi homolog n=1 Tax=Pongo abelii TaxID=9601 RepID=A0A2J8S750_PONAB|nr:ROGDI isoform 11 [Pongo abelii]